MDIKLTLFTQFDAKQFATNVRFFASEKRAELVSRFWDYVANCVQKCYQHGDIKQINKAAIAAELCGYGPSFRRAVPKIIPFKYSKDDRAFEGTIQSGKRNVLEELNENGIPNWEAQLRDNITAETTGKSKTAKPFNLDSRLESIVKAATKEGFTPADIKKHLSEVLSKNAVTAVAKAA